MESISSYETRLAIMEKNIEDILEKLDDIDRTFSGSFARIRVLEISWAKLIGIATGISFVAGGSGAVITASLIGL